MASRTTAIAVFDESAAAQQAIEQLRRAGFTEKEIGVTARDAESRPSIGDGEKQTPAIAGGTLAALLSSAAAGAATAGLAGTLIGLGIPEDEAKYYDEEFRAGRVVVTVDARGRLDEAQAILVRNGGYDMRSAPQRTARTGLRADDDTGVREAGDDVLSDEDTVPVPPPKEDFRVDKRGRTRPTPR
jgi:hypothetical protein